MSRRITFFKKSCVLLLAMIFMQISANALTYTAVASGNFSSGATWNTGTAPSSTILLDQIVIPAGFTVTLDQNVRLNSLVSSIDVDGTLNSTSNSALVLSAGTLTGSGNIDIDSIVLDIATGFNFTGNITADDFSSMALNATTTADIIVNNQLWLAGGSSLDVLTNGSLSLSDNAVIVISGGLLTNTAGTLNLTGNYSVVYDGGSAVGGVELTGSGLQSVTVDLNTIGNTLTLATDLTLNGTLSLTSGVLVLAGNDLNIGTNGNVTGTGSIVSTSTSNISINTTTGTSSTLNFTGTGNAVNNMMVNVAAGSNVNIDGVLTVNGDLNLSSGTLNFSDGALVLAGSLSGTGTLYGNASSNLTVTATTGLSTSLNFAANGQQLNDFTISTGTGTTVTLGSALTVNGTMEIAADNQFIVNDQQLVLNGALEGTGTLTTNSGTSLTFGYENGSNVLFTNTNATVGTFAVDNEGSTVTLNGDLTVTSMLTLQSGRLILNSNDLTITGNISVGGAGFIQSTAASSITVQTTTALSGGLAFSNNANTVDNLTVSVGTGNSLKINSDLNVNGELMLQSGKLDIDVNDLAIVTGATVTGGSADNYVVTSEGGRLQIAVIANSSTKFDVGTNNSYMPALVEMNAGSASGNVSVSVRNDVFAQGNTGTDISTSQPMVDATWYVESDITTNLNMDLRVMWSAAAEVNGFNRSSAHLSHYTESNWDMAANVAATAEANNMFSLRRDGLTSLSPFAVFDENTITGIKETANTVEFRMFPNPASTNLIINCAEANNANLQVDIMDIQGSIIRTYNLSSDNYSLPVGELSNGTYIARVYNANINAVQKFTKL